VVPGFEFRDHEFLEKARLVEIVGEEKADELGLLLRDS
jgi:predicted cupin superfamily sugar epimerase